MPSVAEFLIERLGNFGVKHIFGVPGDYLVDFINSANQSEKVVFVNNTDENHSGFAADAYARAHGVGCVCATYSVGALRLCNAVAGAYAEKSPVIVISGSPGIKERNEDFLLHHVVESFDNQQKIFKHITCHNVVLDDATTAGWKIDNALEILKQNKQPIYIELPRDVATQPIKYDVYRQGTPESQKSDEDSLKDSIQETAEWLVLSKNPVIMVGVQITRFGLNEQLIRFAEKHNIPMVTTLLSKSSVNEDHPLFAGVYCGNQTSQDHVKNIVDGSDCLLILGEMLTDMIAGFETPKFTKKQIIFCSTEGLKIKNHVFKDVKFLDFCKGFFKLELGKKEAPCIKKPEILEFIPSSNTITIERFFQKINSILNEKVSVVADIGESLLGASSLKVCQHHFISPAFYCSMGFAIPGALGLQLAKPNIRPIVLVGDGAFQMSLSELSTILQHKLNPIVFVLNNKGYSTEKLLEKNISIRDWNYHKIFDMIGGGFGYKAVTEEELESSIKLALNSVELSVINVCLETGSSLLKGINSSLKA